MLTQIDPPRADARSATWLAMLDGVVDKLEAGALVADVGCGDGASTILMAQTFPRSQFIGCDPDADAIDTARVRAAHARVANSIRFDVAGATGYGREGFDLIASSDVGDPVAAARHARAALDREGTWMAVVPRADEAHVREAAVLCGFGSVRRAAATDTSVVLEARP